MCRRRRARTRRRIMRAPERPSISDTARLILRRRRSLLSIIGMPRASRVDLVGLVRRATGLGNYMRTFFCLLGKNFFLLN